MDLDKFFNKNKEFDTSLGNVGKDFKSGFVSFIGRPNAGKSTLLNALINKKIAITSNVAQTTRHSFKGIINGNNYQIIINDTPGIHKPKDCLGEELNISAEEAISDCDIACMVIDSSKDIGRGDEWIASKIANLRIPKFCILTKEDISSKEQILKQILSASNLANFDEIIPLSAKTGFNLDILKNALIEKLDYGIRWYSAEVESDVDEEIFIAELIREKILRSVFDEIPHSVGVTIDEMSLSNSGTLHIFAIIYCERESQVGIIIGKNGEMLKKIGTLARGDIEKYMGKKINLQLSVKTKKNWRKDANMIKKFGYGE